MTTVVTTIATDKQLYRVVHDTTIEHAAFVIGSVVDEVTGKAIGNVSVRVDRPAASTRVVRGGFFCVSGSAAKVLPVVPASLTLTFSAEGYRPRSVTIAIPALPVFPVDAGAVALRPLPMRIEGRVTREADRSGIANAEVALKTGTKAVLLRTTAHLDHAAGVTITATSLGVVGPGRTVKGGVRAGVTVVPLDNVVPLAANAILGFGAAPVEYAVIDSVDGAALTVTLKHPLTRSYGDGAVVRERTSTPAGGSAATARSIDAGDGLIVLTAALAASSVEITDPPRFEYHDVNLVADAGGFYAANGIAGVRTLTLTGSFLTGLPNGFVPLDRDIDIDSSRPVAALGFRLKTP